MSDEDETVLPDDVDPDPEKIGDHPEGVTDAEADHGHAVYQAVDDTDDDSNGHDAL